MKKVNKNYNTILMEMCAIKPIAFNPIFAKISGTATAGLFMSQMLFWRDKGKKRDWVYKTIKQFQEETCLTRSEQSTAIRVWKQLGILEVKKSGIPPIRHFRIDFERLANLTKKTMRNGNLQETTNQSAGHNKTICENKPYTPETTPKTTSIDLSLQESVKSEDLTRSRYDLARKLSTM